MSKFKILEWNIRGAATMGWNNNYEIKEFVVDTIMSEKEDIVILNEFVISKGWDYFQAKLADNNYIWFMTYTSSQNGILIAINKNIDDLELEDKKIFGQNLISTKLSSNQIGNPNFLQIKFQVNKQTVYVMGVRIRQDSFKNRRKQFELLLDQVKSIKKDDYIIIAGDFNHGAIKYESDLEYDYKGNDREYYSYQMIFREFMDINCEMHTPDKGRYGHKFSWVMKEPMIKIKEDHLITRGNMILSESDYKWDFLTCGNGYKYLKPEDYKDVKCGYPDHAILIATVEF